MWAAPEAWVVGLRGEVNLETGIFLLQDNFRRGTQL